jgi:hypothetical protein
MSESILLNVESKLASDHDGSYKARLIKKLEVYRDGFATAKQGLLPPDDYDVVYQMEAAVSAAIAVVEAIKPADTDNVPDEASPEVIFGAF